MATKQAFDWAALKPKIFSAKLTDLNPYENNPRINQKAIPYVQRSIKRFGFIVPIVVDTAQTLVIAAGHTRHAAALKLCQEEGKDPSSVEVLCLSAEHLTPSQVRQFRLADNRVATFSQDDADKLRAELKDLVADWDAGDFGFTGDDWEEPSWTEEKLTGVSLADRYVVPPFSVVDSRQGYWRERKADWLKRINSGDGREKELIDYSKGIAKRAGVSSTSIFDPVLCEVLYKWFCPAGGRAIDPFAGGSVRGLVASYLDIEYHGVDLRQEQIDANEEGYKAVANELTIQGNALPKPHWYCGDSAKLDEIVEDEGFDFGITCPPYADLEVYSDNPADISNMEYDDFLKAYSVIIGKACAKLKPNAVFAIVVGDIRDKKGYYRDFIGDTKQAFFKCGLRLLNDIVLVESGASAALRANMMFAKGRKVVKMHQNVLVFVKGNEKKIAFQQYELEKVEESEEGGDGF